MNGYERAPFTYTQRGGVLYRVSKEGYIAKEREPFSNQWRVRGAARFNNFGNMVDFVKFPDCFKEPREWQYKNGKGRWFVADWDHGTNRVQMCPVLRSWSAS